MAQRYKAYFTVPTGRPTPTSAANSSASDTSVLSTSSEHQQPSSYVSIQHPQGCVNPFKISLNLVVNVQPMDNNEQQQRLNGNVTSTPNGAFKDGEDRTMIDNLTPIPKQPATNGQQNSQQSALNGSGSAVSAYHRDDNYGPSTSFTGSGTPANVNAARSDSRSSHDSSKNKTPINRRYKNKQSLLRFSSLNKSRNSSLRTSMNDTLLPRRLSFNESDENEEVFVGESTDSRSPQASLKDERKIQTTGSHRYKNKKSLLSFASLRKHRSKSPEIALPGFQHFLPPRRLNFNEADDETNDVSEYENMRSNVPLDKTFRNSLVFDDGLCPRADVETNKVCVVEAKSSFSHTSQDSFNGDIRQFAKTMMDVICIRANVETSNESDENEEIYGSESTDSRSSQASLKVERKIQTTGNRRNKKGCIIV